MKKLLSAAVLSFVLFGTASVLNFENKEFEVRDLLSETFTNEKVGRKVNVRRANEVEASVAEAVKVQQRYDSESGTYDFRFVAGINTVEIDKAKITIELGGKKASKEITRAYERIQLGEKEKTAAEVFGEGYDYLLAYVLTDVPTTAVNTAFNVNIDLVSEEAVLASADRDVTFSEIIDLDFAPSIEFTNNDELAVVAGSALELPGYTLTNSVDTTYTVNITTNGNGVVENGKYTPDRFSETGVHTLTYTAVHPHTGKELVLGHRNVKVAQKILIGASNYNNIKVNNELTDPVITNTDIGCSGFSFNFDASKYYYAEFDMYITAYTNNAVIGFSHNLGAGGVPADGAYYNGIKMNASGYEYAHSRYQHSWPLHDTRMWMASSYGNRSKHKNPSIINNTTKVAVARDGEKFYTFINDELYNVAVYPELQNKNTYPGVLFQGNDTDVIPVSFSNFNFVREQSEVAAKVASLVGVTTFDHYTRWGSSLSNNFLDFNVENGVVFSDRGANNNSYNDNMASPYVHLYGNWTAEFDYKLGNTNWAGFHFDIRTVWDNFSVMDNRFVSWTNAFGESSITSEVGTLSKTSMLDSLSPLTHRNTIHFTISCSVGSGAETYTITMNDGIVEKTSVIDVTYNKKSYVCGSAKYFIFKSQKWIGTISNFEYSTVAA